MKDAIGHFTGPIESPKVCLGLMLSTVHIDIVIQAFKAEMKSFLRLFTSYTAQRVERKSLYAALLLEAFTCK